MWSIGTFIPIGKLTENDNYSIVSDHLGTPTEMYNSKGMLVWKIVKDIFGRVRHKIGGGTKETDCQIRSQGQYEDYETEMYYNRLRYYMPDEGMYSQRDPIGLAGGNPTLYGYVWDSTQEVDIFGLSKTCPTEGVTEESLKKFSKEFLEWLKKGDKNNVVYHGMKGDTAVYTGITKQDLDTRLYQHNYGPNGKNLKGDICRNYGAVARDRYGYHINVIDLRNPTRSNGNNFLYLVNKYMDKYKISGKLSDKSKAEKYAKIISKTIVNGDGDSSSHGQNAYFYDSAEGLLTSMILLIAEFGEKDKRHIVSVYKIIQELIEVNEAPAKGKDDKSNEFKKLLELLPEDHKARWFAGASVNAPQQQMMAVISTVLSKLNAFLDSELEQILCFDTDLDTEEFCSEKSIMFIILPEEDATKFFMVSLIVQQLYREMLTIADENGGKLKNKVLMLLDEFGTLPPIQSVEMMFSASRSRGISIVAIIQSFAQLEKHYEKTGCEIIVDNTQLTIFGGKVNKKIKVLKLV